MTPKIIDGEENVSSPVTAFSFPTDYQHFIALSRYARFDDTLERRETWEETVSRYFKFFDEHIKKNHEKAFATYEAEREILKSAILNLEVMPSMRALMTAGKALERDVCASYNCSFIPCDHPRAFDEAMYILMCGTGVGFSVEAVHINKLPIISEEFQETDSTIIVPDSKMGWAVSFRELIAMLYAGRIPKWDLSRLRPAGARLKTMGGRSSGPEPLDALFKFAVATFENAAGRKLTSLECHDLMCKIGDVVVVGGVRRSALLSLSDLGDQQMCKAKSGKWWETAPQRALANNSASYSGKPDMETFMREWLSLVESKSGERGIFNLSAARAHASSNGRRDGGKIMGINPCLAGDTLLLTTRGLIPIKTIAENKLHISVLSGDGKYHGITAWKTGEKQVYRVQLSNGQSIRLTENHVIETWERSGERARDCYDVTVKTAVKDLAVGMRIKPFLGELWKDGDAPITKTQAKLFGLLYGDGFRDGNHLAIVTQEKEVINFLQKTLGDKFRKIASPYRYQIRGIRQDMEALGFVFDVLPKRALPKNILTWRADLVCEFLCGLYSANGCTQIKYGRISLKTTSPEMAHVVQLLLIAMGYSAYITTNKPTKIEWPNGTFISKQSYDVNLASSQACGRFQKEIGFLHAHKSIPVDIKARTLRQKSVSITAIEKQDIEPVYDFNEPITHWGWANGLKTHNCGEILLRSNEFCNLSEVVVREDDTMKSLKEKIRVATIFGTLQASLTNFRYLRKIWKLNAEEEALLGVSMTGIMDNEMLATNNEKLPKILQELKEVAIETNKEWAKLLGIKQSASITCIKPAGTTSQLTDTASGIHARHSRFYIRTVRADKKDPLAKMMIDAGFPHEDDVTKPDSVFVFNFPIKSPAHAVLRNDLSAIQQLEIWKTYALNWCEHKPSVTISVKEAEWLEVGAWVYRNFDIMSGVSFLPYADHIYKQAPYQEITETQYKDLLSKMPKNVDWTALAHYESEDMTVGSQTLSCTGGACELVDLIK